MNSSEIYYKALDLERLYDLAFKYDFEIAVKENNLALLKERFDIIKKVIARKEKEEVR